MLVSLNQYREEIESFYNRSNSQITELTICLFNILVNFTENVLVYIIWEILTYLCYVEILNRIQVQGLIPFKASQFARRISIT